MRFIHVISWLNKHSPNSCYSCSKKSIISSISFNQLRKSQTSTLNPHYSCSNPPCAEPENLQCLQNFPQALQKFLNALQIFVSWESSAEACVFITTVPSRINNKTMCAERRGNPDRDNRFAVFLLAFREKMWNVFAISYLLSKFAKTNYQNT